MPLVAQFVRFGLAKVEGHVLTLELNATQHALDCGAPDGYGTEIRLKIELTPTPYQCLVSGAEVHTKNWGKMNEGWQGEKAERFKVESHAIDLSHPKLERLILRSHRGDRSLIILRDNFFYFDDVKPGGVLFTDFDAYEDELEGNPGPTCCFGAWQNHFTFESSSYE